MREIASADPLTLEFWITSATGGTHAVLAIICLLLGPVIFIRRKGDKTHKMLGRIWAMMMLVLNITALMTYELHGRPNLFHAFAVLNLVALIPAFCLYQKIPDKPQSETFAAASRAHGLGLFRTGRGRRLAGRHYAAAL